MYLLAAVLRLGAAPDFDYGMTTGLR